MKRLFTLALATVFLVSAINACGQEDKSKRPSPPAKASEKIASGATVTIDYSKPSVKGRTIGKDLEPMDGKVWRTGANEATVFTVDKDVKVEGKTLAAGKYGLFTISGPTEWTIIFNKTWNQWGAFNYKEGDDILRVKVKPGKAPAFAEQFNVSVAKTGKVSMLWGDKQVDFNVQ